MEKTNEEKNKRIWKYYKLQNSDWTQEKCEEDARKYRKSCNYNNIEYYERFYPELSHEEQENLRQEKIYSSKKNNPTKIEYYIENYPNATDEERYNMWHEFNQSRCPQHISFYERKYPDLSHEEHVKMMEDYKKSYTSKREPWTGENNCNSKENTTELQRRSRSPRCIEFYERKYPDKSHEFHQQQLNNYFEKVRKSIKEAIKDTNIEYYLNQGMSVFEAKLALKERQRTFSLEKCIKKYGKEEGTKIFKERQKRWIKSLKKNFNENGFTNMFQSKLGNLIITDISKNLNITNINDYVEYYIHDYEYDRGFVYDFIYNDKIIEINGDYWHCNPKLYSADFYNSSKKKTAQELWDIDKRKKEIAELNGFKLLVIWESDYNMNPEETIKKCLEFLK